MLKMAQLSHPPLAVFDAALSGDHAPKLYRCEAELSCVVWCALPCACVYVACLLDRKAMELVQSAAAYFHCAVRL